jgi:hypothetical protein
MIYVSANQKAVSLNLRRYVGEPAVVGGAGGAKRQGGRAGWGLYSCASSSPCHSFVKPFYLSKETVLPIR